MAKGNVTVTVVPCTCKWPGLRCPTHSPTLLARALDVTVCTVAILVGVIAGAAFTMALTLVAPWWAGAAAATVGYVAWRKWAPR